jgi:hypothetical protein
MIERQPWLDESFDFPVEVTGGPGIKQPGRLKKLAAKVT